MSLLNAFLELVNSWRSTFTKEDAFKRAREHAVSSLCCFGRHTITSMAFFAGRDKAKPSADYKLYSCSKWNVEDLFNPILKKSIHLFDSPYLVLAADDTKLRKSGKKIPHASWQRDPMSPPFHTNFIWGLRFLQFSILLPMYKKGDIPCRSIPIRFVEAPCVKRPRKKSSLEEQETYKKLQKKHNLSTLFVNELRSIRDTLDSQGASDKKILMTLDGSYCNKTCFSANIPNTVLVARCRKNARLCKPYTGSSKMKIYADEKFTPEDVRANPSIPWQKSTFYYGGAERLLKYKEVNSVLWQSGTAKQPLRLLVLTPLPYVRGGKRNYRSPAYLLTTDFEASASFLIQSYLDHFQIEYNHRDEKSILGVGQAQVRNEKSIYKQPGLCVASYSALLMASVLSYDDQPLITQDDPKWRPRRKRNSCRALIGLMRSTLIESPDKILELDLTPPMIAMILRKAA